MISQELAPGLALLERSRAGIPLSEAEAVAICSLDFVGFTYGISRELRPGEIDCSTLISQAYWLGAGIRLPFRADDQLRSPMAESVNAADLLPGDLVFAYPSASESFNGRHNHVAMALGKDGWGEDWVIESSDPDGAHYARLAHARLGGGFRRISNHTAPGLGTGEWIDLARRVPKLCRLGARLTSGTSTHHRRHMGTDIVLDAPTSIAAPVSGRVSRLVYTQGSEVAAIEVLAADRNSVHVLGPFGRTECSLGEDVVRGQVLGRTSSVPVAGCNVTQLTRRRHRVHWEVWATERSRATYEPLLPFEQRMTAVGPTSPPMLAQNPVYLMRLGAVGSPTAGPVIPHV